MLNLIKIMKKYKIFFIVAIIVIITYIIYNNMETFKVGSQECSSDQFEELCQHTYTFVNTCNNETVYNFRTSDSYRDKS